MIVYHGSSEVVRQPDILHSYRALVSERASM